MVRMGTAFRTTFHAPLDIIDGFHEAMRRNARALCAIADACEAPGFPSAAERERAREILRCFDEAAFEHHRDEEEDLFPALVHVVPSTELNAVRSLVFRLRRDHRRLEALWAPLSRMVAAIAQGHRVPLVPAHAAEFCVTLERHLDHEDAELLPLARRVMDQRRAQRMAERMARRRLPVT
jgi:hemerythrin-like domain-containing protein